MTEKRKRRWYQFSLRTLLVFVLLASIGMSWLGVRMDRARKQREAVRVIRELGGVVVFDYELRQSNSPYPAEPPAPKWALTLLGNDFFFDVVEVFVFEKDFGDDEASHFKALTNLTSLDLSHTQVTDAGLVHLEGLTSLVYVDLNGTKITDAGLEHLVGLTNLEHLLIADTEITDEGIEKLQKALPECWIISVDLTAHD